MASSGHPLPDSVPAALARGSSIGRYIVLTMVGRGGMGEVYAAYDPEMDRKVAVKLLRVKPGNGVTLSEGRTRTLREAQAIARLNHPNVVIAYDVGTFEDKVFIAMEYVEGATLTYWLKSQERSWREILRVFMDAGRGLHAAHDKALVHRDFKTDNVMISRDRHVRVMDFGLARQAEKPSSPGEPANTTTLESGATSRKKTPPKAIPIRIFETGAAPGSASAQSPAAGQSASLDSPAAALPAEPSESPTMVISNAGSAPVAALAGHSTSGAFDSRLTRTGAMMGTPAYMAPEQFLGTPTDARSDQFSFCISLYEALYGERPFEGSSMTTLTSNVVHGHVRAAPDGSKVPLWVRRVLLRGLQPRARDRWASMEALIEALGKDPNVARRKWAAAAGGALVMGGVALGAWRMVAAQNQVCSGGPPKLAGIWDLPKPGDPEPARHAQIRQAFMATGKSYAPDVFATVSHALTTYAQNWANMHKEACEATRVRGEQSEEVMDLRISCLHERLGGFRALTDVFTEADGEVVEKAVSAANALETLDRCQDVPLLRAVVRPPEDPATRARVMELRNRLGELKARFDSGSWKEALKRAPTLVDEARKLGYEPLLAEALLLQGTIAYRSSIVSDAEKLLAEAYLVAEESRHDEVRAEAGTGLVWVVGYQKGQLPEAQRWAREAGSILKRLGGHELLEAWLQNDLGAVFSLAGDKEAFLRYEESALGLKRKVLGPSHPDVGLSEGNVAFALQELGRGAEALVHVDRSLAILQGGLGASHPDLAVQFSNRGEILNGLRRFREARFAFEKARNTWERELGPDDRNLGYALTGIGATYLADGDPNSALVPLERALKIREARETDPAQLAETSFLLAKALWESHRDRGRTQFLAESARARYEKTQAKTKVAEVDQWLRGRFPFEPGTRAEVSLRPTQPRGSPPKTVD